MSILAEPRRKRKMCIDPQNLNWKNDTNKFGHKMLQNMGWSEGQGLGINNQGMTENLKLKANFTQKGIGAEANDYDKTWVQHHDEFSFLLEKLNAKKAQQPVTKEEEESEISEDEQEAPTAKKTKEENTSKSLEERSRATKTRIHYKYTKMKDLSRYSQKDKSAVIGVGLKSKAKEDEASKEGEKTNKTFEEPATVKNSVVSVSDYFASKMAKFYAKKNGVSDIVETVEEKVEIVEQEVNAEEEERRRRKAEKKALKKAKREAQAKVETEEAVVAEDFENDEEEKRRRKAERKERKRKERQAAALDLEE